MKITILLTLIAVGTASLLPAQNINGEKKVEVQVRYTTDIRQTMMYTSRLMADTLLARYKDQIVSQIGNEKYEEVLDGIYDQVFPCELAFICNNLLNNADTVAMRKANLTIYRVATFERRRNMSVIEFEGIRTPAGTKLYAIIPSKYLSVVEGVKVQPIAPRMLPQNVRIIDWNGLKLRQPEGHSYWYNEDNPAGMSRLTFITHQVGAVYATHIYSQALRTATMKNYLPKEVAGIDSAGSDVKKLRLQDAKLYYIADVDPAAADDTQQAILWMPYAENQTFYKGDK